jgi:signal transduction histidine kinase
VIFWFSLLFWWFGAVAQPISVKFDSRINREVSVVSPPEVQLGGKKLLPPPAVLNHAFTDSYPRKETVIQHWIYIRFQLANPSPDTLNLRLFAGYFGQQIVFFRSTDAPDWNSVNTGQQQAAPKGQSALYRLTAPVTFPPNDTLSFLIASRYPQTTGLRNIWIEHPTTTRTQSLEQFYDRRNVLVIAYGALAVVLFQLVFILGLYFIASKSTYLYYALYIASFSLFLFTRYHTYAYGVFPPWWPDSLLRVIAMVSPFLSYFFYLRFVRHFLNLSRPFPILTRWVVRGEWLSMAFVAFALIFQQMLPLAVSILFYAVSIALLLLALVMLLRVIQLRTPEMYLIAAGSAAFVFGVGYGILGRIFLLVKGEGSLSLGVDQMMVGFLVELCMFTLALAYTLRKEETLKLEAERLLVRRLQENQELRERVETLRNRVARDLHDDIGATLTSISLYSELAARVGDGEKSRDLLRRISDSARTMTVAMRDTLWTLQPRKDTIMAFANRVSDLASAMLGPAGVQVQLHTEGIGEPDVLDMEKRQSLYLIAKEAINNIAKYAQATEVAISLSVSEKNLHLTITDNGKGFDPGSAGKGNGFLNFQERTREMEGEMTLESQPGTGTTLRVIIPLPEIGDKEAV